MTVLTEVPALIELPAELLAADELVLKEPLVKNVPRATMVIARNAVMAGSFLSILRTRAEGASFSISANQSGFCGGVFEVIGDSFQ